MQILVLGMHRSGTSLTTRLINMMGAYFGPESSIGGINEYNPKGYWERPEVFKLNDALLAMRGCSWHDLSGWKENESYNAPEPMIHSIRKIIVGMDAFRPWVLKDPRLCLTLPVWQRFLEVPIAVIVHRDPLEIAVSLQKRDGFDLEKGIALWQLYAAGIVRNTQDMPKIYVQHQALLNNPVDACYALHRQLLELGVRRIEMPSTREITAFIDPQLYRSKDIDSDYTLTAEQQSLEERIAGKIA